MSSQSVPARPLSDNDVEVLAELFEISVDFFRTHQSPNAKDFIATLRTLAGLGFTASLVDDGGIMPYQTYFNRFLDAKQGDFMEDKTLHKSTWGQTMANMVKMGLDSFRRIHYPAYYADFREAIKRSTQNVVIEHVGKAKQAERIMCLLPPPLKGRGGLLY